MSNSQLSTTRRDALKLIGGAASAAAVSAGRANVLLAAAPMLGVSRPSIYRFKLGSFEVTQHPRRLTSSRRACIPTFGANQRPRPCRLSLRQHTA